MGQDEQEVQRFVLDPDHWEPTLLVDGEKTGFFAPKISTDAGQRVTFSFTGKETELSALFRAEQYEIAFADGSRHEFLYTSKTVNSEGRVIVSGFVNPSPLVLSFGGDISSATGRILNLDPRLMEHDLQLEAESYKFVARKDKDATETYKVAKKSGASVVHTGSFELIAKHGSMTHEEVSRAISEIWRFLRFIAGSDISVGPWIAIDASSNSVSAQLEPLRCDPPSKSSNWASFNAAHEISKLFGLFQKAQIDDELASVLDRSFDLYRTSTAARDHASLETGILVAQSLLELLANFVLTRHAGWTTDLLNRSGGFHNRLSASAKAIGFRNGLFPSDAEILAATSSNNPVNQFHSMTMLRNDFTHPKRNLKISGLGLVQCWSAAMFLAELHIFFALNYRGEMADRRRLSGWWGETIQTPLTALRE